MGKLSINNDEDIPIIKDKLKKYIKVEERHIDIIPVGVYIRFINKETGELKGGGIVAKNYDREHEYYNYILILVANKYYFKVIKTRHVYFIRDDDDKKIEQAEKDNLYKLYKQGLVKIVEDNEIIPNDYCDEYYLK
jgi:hypothetical protein